MTGHDGCGCGHSHTMQAEVHASGGHAHEGHQQDGHQQDGQEMGGCGDGCGCGHGAETNPIETAALRGFLSGIYAARLDAAQLKTYLEQMGEDEGSEFGRPAQFLATVLADLEEQEALTDEEAPAFTLLEAVAGEDDEEEGEEE